MPTELMALIDAYAATSAVNGIRSQWAQMARGKVDWLSSSCQHPRCIQTQGMQS